ncbi:MIT-like protein [Pleurostoma richardsiae]|uniref:MIT-like protein n=1 Tax=Pleurostoma richardsiae TaxID=41990 RepID=A0AA38VJ34_9PEZI|nr:MIT-like protein [Pleurostoma richardsiae]
MEASPLIRAHDHARAAANATQTAESTVAINEHALAAGEFSNAAKNTTSVEALRTLRLLEQHHRKLSELLKFSQEHPVQQAIVEKETAGPEEKQSPDAQGVVATSESKSEQAVPSTPSPAAAPISAQAQQRRYPPARELSSSIASNLANARGIRSSRYRGQPLTPSVSNDQAPGNLEVQARKDGSRSKMQHMLDQTGKPSWVPPPRTAPQRSESQAPSLEDVRPDEADAPVAEEGFYRFYKSFGHIINKISAPLAFAGLPLIAEEPVPQSSPRPEAPAPTKRSRHRSPQAFREEPDLSRIYSKAAMRAIPRDGNAGNDSFYVVPTSGHTVSYANILSFDQKERRRMAASLHGEDDIIGEVDEEDFVDARESPLPLSPAAKKRVGKGRTDRDFSNAIEELSTENASLKDMLDKVTKRLHAFEATAQTSRLALAESMRFMKPGSPLSSSGGGGTGPTQAADEVLRKKNRELEEELAAAAKHMEALEKEYAHAQRNLGKYRDKWDKLKAGAKARREAQGSSADNGESSKAAAS